MGAGVIKRSHKGRGRARTQPMAEINVTPFVDVMLVLLIIFMVITPLVQKNVASLPVVLGIFAVVGLGTLFGPLGVLFATPLTLVLYTAITMLYRQDVLHDEEAHAPGETLR